MQTKVMAAESKLKAKQAEEAGQPAPLRVHAISYSPGIMDTALQVEISEAADHPSKTFLGNVVSSVRLASLPLPLLRLPSFAQG